MGMSTRVKLTMIVGILTVLTFYTVVNSNSRYNSNTHYDHCRLERGNSDTHDNSNSKSDVYQML